MQEVSYITQLCAHRGGKEEGTVFAFAKGLLFSCISPPHFFQEEPREDVVNNNVVIISLEVTSWLIFS